MLDTLERIVRGIIVKDGKILLCKNLEKGHYFLPGGQVEEGETSEVALRRELEEETGEIPTKTKLVAEVENSFVEDGVERQEIFYIFLVLLENNLEIQSKENHIAFEWVDINDLMSVNFKPRKSVENILMCIKENNDFWNGN